MVEIRLRGPGGHTARPERTVDLVDVLARIVTGLQPAIDTLTVGGGDLSVVFGAVHAGDAANVIPAHGHLRGTLRTRDHDVWLRSPELFDRALATVLGGTVAAWEVSYRRGVPPVVNDERQTELMTASVRAALGDSAVVSTDQSLGGDSFAWYLEKIPGSYARLGVHDPRTSAERLDLHASTFDIDERAIAAGVRVLVTTALDALAAN
jgi:amidohydrolase